MIRCLNEIYIFYKTNFFFLDNIVYLKICNNLFHTFFHLDYLSVNVYNMFESVALLCHTKYIYIFNYNNNLLFLLKLTM